MLGCKELLGVDGTAMEEGVPHDQVNEVWQEINARDKNRYFWDGVLSSSQVSVRRVASFMSDHAVPTHTKTMQQVCIYLCYSWLE